MALCADRIGQDPGEGDRHPDIQFPNVAPMHLRGRLAHAPWCYYREVYVSGKFLNDLAGAKLDFHAGPLGFAAQQSPAFPRINGGLVRVLGAGPGKDSVSAGCDIS